MNPPQANFNPETTIPTRLVMAKNDAYLTFTPVH
jgi:hypothetical protein